MKEQNLRKSSGDRYLSVHVFSNSDEFLPKNLKCKFIFFALFVSHLVNVVHHFQVDFKQMEIVRPTRQHIRRTFTPGISLEYTSSPNEHTLSTKINSVQVSERKIEGEELWQTRLKSF